MDSWKKADGKLFFSGMKNIEQSDNVVVVGDDTYFAIKDLSEQLPFSNIIGFIFNEDIYKRVNDLVQNLENKNVVVTNNLDDIIYSLYEFANYNENINTLIFPGTLSQIRTDTSINKFNDTIQEFLDMDFTNIVLYDSFCYKSLCQTTPLELYLSVMNDPRFDKKMIHTYELFYGSIMYYVNFIRFFIKYKLWEDCGGGYEWFDILEDCQELSINWNDFIRNIIQSGYNVNYIRMFADSDLKDFVEEKIGHTIKIATQTRAVFIKRDSIYAKDK